MKKEQAPGLRVMSVKAENFKRLKAVELNLDGNSVIVSGKNGRGKSSFIDCIWIALTNQNPPEKPIAEGEKSAEVTVKSGQDGGNYYTVVRRWTEKTTTLTVSTPDGAKYGSPQKFLDEMLGNISFDPLEFISMQPMKQRSFLLDLLGLDLDSFENRKKTLSNERTQIGTRFKEREARYRAFLETNPLPEVIPAFVDVSGIKEKIKNAGEGQRKQQELKSFLENATATKASLQSWKDQNQKAIFDLEKEYSEKRQALKKRDEDYDQKILIATEKETEAKDAFDKFQVEDVSDLMHELETAEKDNAIIEASKTADQLGKEVNETIDEGRANRKKLDDLETEKNEAIKNVEMPLPGLSFSDSGLLLDGLPFTEEQLSRARIIQAGVAISMALNPNIRILKIKDGSLLDSETLQAIQQAAGDKGYQLFIEKVSDDEEIGFEIIEEF